MKPPPDPETERQAADWFARLKASTVSVSELESFRRWKATPERRRAYERLERLWAESGPLRHDDGVQAAVAAARNRPRRAHDRGRAYGAAAACAVAAALAFGVWSLSRPQVYATEVGERRVFQLLDGSEVHLDADSRLTVRMRRRNRDLDLQRGQALFTVARDRDRPFVVRAADTRVVATGTRFGVRRRPEGVRVTLLEGGVTVEREVGPGRRTWTLSAGQQLRPGLAAEPVAVRPEAATGWTEGRLEFEAAALSEAVREVARHDRRGISLGPGVDPDLVVTGVFNAGDAPAFAEAVARVHGLAAIPTPDGGVVIARPRKK